MSSLGVPIDEQRSVTVKDGAWTTPGDPMTVLLWNHETTLAFASIPCDDNETSTMYAIARAFAAGYDDARERLKELI